MEKKITKKDIIDLMDSTRASEQQLQVATARYDQCKTDAERSELLKALTEERATLARSREGAKALESGSNKALAGGDDKNKGDDSANKSAGDPNAGKVLASSRVSTPAPVQKVAESTIPATGSTSGASGANSADSTAQKSETSETSETASDSDSDKSEKSE